MSHNLFDWSYPPGCDGTPYDDDYPCELCGVDPVSCDCPVCGVCSEQGNPACYDNEGHGLEETTRQAQIRRAHETGLLILHDAPILADVDEWDEAGWCKEQSTQEE